MAYPSDARDFDAELKALEEKARDLTTRKVQQLGELVIATGADWFTAEELAGALVVLAETQDLTNRDPWAKRCAALVVSSMPMFRLHLSRWGLKDDVRSL